MRSKFARSGWPRSATTMNDRPEWSRSSLRVRACAAGEPWVSASATPLKLHRHADRLASRYAATRSRVPQVAEQ